MKLKDDLIQSASQTLQMWEGGGQKRFEWVGSQAQREREGDPSYHIFSLSSNHVLANTA